MRKIKTSLYEWCKENDKDYLIEQWDYTKNIVNPKEISYGTNKKAWWKCEKGHCWCVAINTRRYGNNCPVCAGQIAIPGVNDLVTKFAEVLQDWDYEKNRGVDPTKILPYSNKKVWWKCSQGHTWQTKVINRVKSKGCPVCNKYNRTSFPEKTIYYYILKTFEDTVGGYKAKWLGRKELDIYIPSLKIAIEYDGIMHIKERDLVKNKICEENEVTLIRVRDSKLETLNDTSIDIMIQGNNENMLREAIYKILNCINKLYNLKKEVDVDIERDRIKIYRELKLNEIEK